MKSNATASAFLVTFLNFALPDLLSFTSTTVSPVAETGNLGDGLQSVNAATTHSQAEGEAELAHREQVEAYVSSDEFNNGQKETGRVIAMKRYASRFVDMAKELSTKAYRQFSNLIRETIRERDRDRGYER